MRAYWKLTLASLKEVFRERTTLFWNFVFPVLFILVLGLVFGGDAPSFPVGFVSSPTAPVGQQIGGALAAVSVFKLHTGDFAQEMEALRRGERRAVVIVSGGDNVAPAVGERPQIDVYFDPSQQTAAQVVLPLIRQVVDDLMQQTAGQPALYRLETHSITTKALRQIDYITPGILAYSIMQLGLFGALPLIILRENKVLKRLHATPLSRRTIVAAQVTTRVVIAGAQLALIVGFARLTFGVQTGEAWWLLIGLVVLGTLTFVSLGYAVSALARTQEGVMPIVQIISFPMLILSGVFFPLEFLPGFVRQIAVALPLTFLADALRQVTVAATPVHPLRTDIIVLTGWLVASFLAAVRFFRWT